MRFGTLVVAVLAIGLGPGCLAGFNAAPTDTTIDRHATLTMTNAEEEQVRLKAASTLGGEPVDVTYRVFTPNRTADVSLGLPAQGNVEIVLTHTGTGESHTFTVAVGSCKGLRINGAIENGRPHTQDIVCT